MYLPTLNIEFIPTFDSRVLLVADTSIWLHLQKEQTFLDVTTPGRDTYITIPFTKGKTLSLNSNLLDLTCSDTEAGLIGLPDGVYTFTLKVCDGDKFKETFYYLRTVNLQTELDNYLIELTIDSCDDNYLCINKYFEIQLLLDAAHAHVRRGNIKRASYNYNLAKDLLDDLQNCGCGE